MRTAQHYPFHRNMLLSMFECDKVKNKENIKYMCYMGIYGIMENVNNLNYIVE